MSTTLERPKWLTRRISNIEAIDETVEILKSLSLNTVCDGAQCPNIGECFGNNTATFMILGNVCTRQCKFCAVTKGKTEPVNHSEPENIGIACKEMGLKHVVVTSVTRDDLPDGGAEHFAETVNEIKKRNPLSTIELLIPDLKGNWEALQTIIKSKPDIINHNLETVSTLYGEVRPQAQYERSLELLENVKKFDQDIYTKSGIMVGLGEKEEEIYSLMDDLRTFDCDILTIGQYLQPSKQHIEIKEYIHPVVFEKYKKAADEKGFKYVASGPFVRSSYNAALGINSLKK
ncbi:MAG: lipoyl synthase [Bacillota bacterium]